MKRIITCFLVVLILTVNVFAFESKEANFTFTTPEGYTELSPENIKSKDNEMFLTLLSHSKESFVKYFNDNNVKYFSLKGDNSAQIMVRVAATNFTEALNNMSAVDEAKLKDVARLFLPDNAPYAKVKTNGTVYLQTVSSNSDSGGDFSSVTYVTIKNGMLYTIVFSYPKTENLQPILNESFNNMANFTIEDKNASAVWSFENILLVLLMFGGAAVVTAFIILIIISFAKDIKRKHKEDSLGEFKIKRRKF